MAEQAKIPFGEGVSELLDKMNGISHGAKEVFLWELVRNAARALYEIRVKTLFETDLIGDRGLFIDIIPDKSNHTLSIVDNGIGMAEDDVKNRLFTVPERALKKYKKAIHKLVKNKVNVDQFYTRTWDLRLGFFAAYMVADKVQITTKRYGGDRQCTVFSSARDRSFFFVDRPCTRSCTISSPRGTKVTLQLNKDHFEYLDERRLKVLIDKYTFDICPYPIFICVHPSGNIIQRFADVEEKNKDMELMKRKFEGLRKLFGEVLGDWPVKEVVVSDRIYDLPTFLSLDRKTLEINPRSSLIEKLRQDAERNPKDKEVVAMIRLQYVSGVGSICVYDVRHGTNHLRTTRSEAEQFLSEYDSKRGGTIHP